MATVVCAALALVLGAPWPIWGSLLAFAASPTIGVCTLGAILVLGLASRVRSGPGSDAGEVAFLRSISASMAAGATLRDAVAGARSDVVDDRVRRLCLVGVPMRDVARSLAPRLGGSAASFEVIADLSEDAGAAVVEACHVLAVQADARRSERGESRVATAQARFSAVLVGVVPLVLAVLLVLLRGVPDPGGAAVMVPMAAGGVLMVAGTTLVVAVSRKASS